MGEEHRHLAVDGGAAVPGREVGATQPHPVRGPQPSDELRMADAADGATDLEVAAQEAAATGLGHAVSFDGRLRWGVAEAVRDGRRESHPQRGAARGRTR